jgi:TolB-like protein/Tfp pilus assembly protein PilF
MSLFNELKRRNVFRVGIAYIIASWLLMQVADLVFPRIGLEDSAVTLVIALLGIGFIPALIFAWAFEMTPEGIKKEKDVNRAESITQTTGRKLDFTIIGILAVAVAFLLFDRFSQPQPEDNVIPDRAQRASGTQSKVIGGDPDQASGEAGAAQSTSGEGDLDLPRQKSIAVLPFVNMSDDASNEYFSDGISEEILNALAKVKELKVAGRTSSFAFKGQNQDLRQIGETLGVEHILEGSVRKAGDKVRITAQLIQVDDGFHLWSDSYDRELTDVFAIQDEIAAAILEQLKAELLDTDPAQVAAARTNSDAYDLYLLARQRIYERARLSLESALSLLDEAITLDAEYAPAYAQRAIATLLLSDDSYGVIPAEQAEAQARLYIDKALQLDPEQAEAWAALGLYHNSRIGEYELAIEALDKALSINPNLINAHNWLYISHNSQGNPGEALRMVDEMIEMDPLYRPGVANAINTYTEFGLDDKATVLLDRVAPFMPYDSNIIKGRAVVHYSRGEYAAGLPQAETALELLPDQQTAKDVFGVGLVATHQYERAADIKGSFMEVQALINLHRNEEALIRASEGVDGLFGAGPLFWALNVLDRSNELTAYIDDRWDSLEALQREFPPFAGFGYGLMNDVALAYARTGNEAEFEDAMSRVRALHDALISQGVKNGNLWLNEAVHYALAGDYTTALVNLSKAVDDGLITSARISFEYPALKPLEGDPQYEALQAQMIDRLNTEREKLELEPVRT